MRCPRCHRPLFRSLRAPLRVWACVHCRGCTANLTALRRVILPEALQRAWNLTIGRVRKSLLRCPSCARAMNVVPTDGVIIDMCRPCQLMWFDPGELDALPHRSAEELAAEERRSTARSRLLGRGDVTKLLGQRGSYPAAS